MKCVGIPGYGGIQPTGVVTWQWEYYITVITHALCDLPDMYAPWIPDIHIRQIPRPCTVYTM